MSILQMSFSAAVLVMVITVIRAIAINKIPKKAFLLLWIVVVLRLLVPFSVPSSFSVYSLLNTGTSATEKIAEAPAAYIIPVIVHTTLENTADVSSPQLPLEEKAKSSDAPSLWMITWVVGAVMLALYFATAYIRFYKRFQTSVIVKNDFTTAWLKEHKILRSISIRQSSRITTPMTYGVFRPVILLPEKIDWSDEKQLRYILMHEYVHIRRFDIAAKLLLTAALCIHWFNPLVWVMYILANRDLELTCDETVVRHFGETIKSSYALALLKLEEQKNDFAPYYSSFSKNAAEERICSIMKYKKSSVMATLLAMALVIGTTTAFASSAAPFADVKSLMSKEDVERLTQEVAENISAKYNEKYYAAYAGRSTNGHVSQSEIDRLAEEAAAEALALYNEDLLKLQEIAEEFWKSAIVNIDEAEIERSVQEATTEAMTEAMTLYDANMIKSIDKAYSEYGLVLNQSDGRLYYKNQLVKCFSENYIERVINLDGDVDVNATRNSSGEIVGVEPYNRQELVGQIKASLNGPAATDFHEIWTKAHDAVLRGVVFWPLPDGQREAHWNYTAWSAVWNEQWQKAEKGGYLDSLRDYVINRLIVAADDSGSWRNLYQNLYDTSVGLLND